MKPYKKRIIKLTLASTIVITIVISICYYLKQKKEEKELYDAIVNPYFTEEHFTMDQMYILTRYLYVDTDPYYSDDYDKHRRQDHSNVVLTVTEKTEHAIDVINFYLFDFGYPNEARVYAEECGLSYNNRITLDWFNKNKKKVIIIASAVTTGITDLWPYDEISPIYNYIHSNAYFTSQKLNYNELTCISHLLSLDATPSINESISAIEESKATDFSTMTFQATEYTEHVVAVLNYLFFTTQGPECGNGIAKAAEYGITKSNPFTTEWVVTHPKDFLAIKNSMTNYGEILYYDEKINQIYYDKIEPK